MRKALSFLNSFFIFLLSIGFFHPVQPAFGAPNIVPQTSLLLLNKKDCNGDSRGTAYLDNCAICVEGNTGLTACTQDCSGEWGGTAYSDNCFQCVGGNTGLLACTQDCNNEWGGTAITNTCGCVGGNTGVDNTVTCVTSDGRVWMDRNLGASQVATSATDPLSYGDYYQWGRLADGHEISNSPTTTSLSSIDVPGHGSFILTNNDWRSPSNDALWQGVNGINNPCPGGFRIPTRDEWLAEISAYPQQGMTTPLKIPYAGYRDQSTGLISDGGGSGFYWASTIGTNSMSYLYYSYPGGAYTSDDFRGWGQSVRCIKN